MINKVRRVDLWFDDFLAAVAGEMSPAELGVYWMVCLLCYTRGGSIPADPELLRRKFRADKGNRVVAPLLERLIKSGRVVREGSEISVRRVREELERVLRRNRDLSEIGTRGGRPSNKLNGVEKATGSPTRETTSNQLTTNNQDARAARSSFAEFWVAYPHKVGKGAAERAFKTAIKSVTLDELLAGIRRYVDTKPPDRNYCNPSTWLNQRRWEDELNLGGHDEHLTDDERQSSLLEARRAAGLCDAD